jgi:hypothetical protein
VTAGGTLCRLEYLTRKGWVVGHAGIALLHPDRYVERLTERGKFGRCTELDGMLQPTGKVHISPNIPEDLSVLVADPPHRIPRMPTDKDKRCDYCEDVHPAPWNGTCLL